MYSRISLALMIAGALLAPLIKVERVDAIDRFWDGGAGNSNWLTATNWNPNFVPSARFSERAVVGTTTAPGLPNPTVTFSSNPAGDDRQSGGLVLGAQPATSGTLTISAGAMSHRSTGQATSGANGAVYLGVFFNGTLTQGGIGNLNMTGGSLTATGLFVEGETVGETRSSVDLSGSSTVTLGPVADVICLPGCSPTVGIGADNLRFARDLTITGPSVNFANTGNMEFQATNIYNANITSATAHSTLKTTGNVSLAGTINIAFSGLANNPAVNQTWNLIDYGGNLFGNFSNAPFNAGVAVSGLPEPIELGAAFKLRRVDGGVNGKLVQLIQQGLIVLRVNRDTGELSLTNPHGTQIQIDGYRIASDLGSLLPGYKGISGAPAGDTGWQKPITNSETGLAELKSQPFTYKDLTAIPSLTLGTGAGKGFDKFAVAEDIANFGTDGEDLQFIYSTPDGPVTGHIEYIGTKFENNLVLRVNPTTGEAFLKNDSHHTLTFDGYSILSSTNSLDSAGFDGLGGTWLSTDLEPSALSETNLFGSITLEPEDEVALGDIGAFATTAEQAGLSMKFILSVALGGGAALTGDYNGDGTVNAADYVVWRKTNVGGSGGYDDWRENFGETGGGSAPPELTYRTGSIFFDTMAGAGGGLAAVPEPSAMWLLLVGLAGTLAFGRSRARNSQQLVYAVAARNSRTQEQEEVGGCTMSKQFGFCLSAAIAIGMALIATQPAAAAPQGALLVNYDFEDPGPPDVKAFAFDATGVPVAGAIPGWTFTGPGTETFGHPEQIGDSGTEGDGNPGNEMILSMNDGKAYQIASNFTIQSIPSTQIYKFALDAHDIFTTNAALQGIPDSAQLTARFFYGPWASNQTLMTQVINLTGTHTRYEFTIPHNSALLTPALGQTLGVEFTTTSPARNPLAVKSWSGIDNVIMEIAPILTGDFDGNGSLAAADYNILASNIEDTCYASPAGIRGCPFDADGDLTGDYVVDLNDFRAFKTLFAAGAGSGDVPAGGGGNVPEPSTAGLVLVAAAAVAAARARVRTDRLKTADYRWLPALALAVVAGSAAFLATSPSHAELYVYDPFLLPSPLTNPANPALGQYNEWTPPGPGATEPYGPHVPMTGQNPTPQFGTRPNFFNGPWDAWTVGHVVHPTSVGYINTPTMGGSARVAPQPNPAYTGPATSVCGTDSGALYSGCDGRAARFFATPYDDTANETVYISFIANFGETTGGMGYRAVEFYPSTATPESEWGETRIGELGYNEFFGYDNPAQQNPTTARLGLGLGTQVIVTDAPTSYNEDGRNHLFVLKLVFSNQPGMDSMFLYMDPASTQEPEIANAEHINTNFTLGAITTTTRYGGTVPSLATMGEIGSTGLFDELRIGSTYADVLPPGLPVPGDADGDMDVDLDDYVIVRDNFHRTDAGGPIDGDVGRSDGRLGFDGKVDIGDFWLWKREYEKALSGSGGEGGSNVPEPATALLAIVAASLWMASLRRKSCIIRES